MTRFFIALGSLMVAITLQAQTTNTVGTASLFGTYIPGPQPPATVPKVLRPNEIQAGKLTLDGIAVQIAKTRNPLQLINPAAPPSYGSWQNNVAWNPTTGRATGLKIFGIQF